MTKRPSFYHHLHPPKIPQREAGFWYTLGLGGLSLLMLLIVSLTGALELFYYTPSLEGANRSLQTIHYLVPYGRLVRSLHYWSAQALLALATLHMLRVVFTGAYKHPRRFNWLLGLGILVLVLLLNFTGYGLRWDTEISWALTVGTNLLKTIPLLGEALYSLVVGGSELGEATIVRFHGWHVFGLPLAVIILAGWHLFRVRRDGGISRNPQARPRATISREVLVRKEALAALLACAVLVVVAALLPPVLGPEADFQNIPQEAAAPWFFLWIQQLLRLGSPFLLGVLIPACVLVALALIPYLIDRREQGVARWFNRPGRAAQVSALALFAGILALSLWGILR